MPISKAYPISEVMDTLAKHIRETNRKVFIAYILLGAETDTPEHAKALVELINRYEDEAYLFHVNLINFHEIPGQIDFKRTTSDKLQTFRDILHNSGVRTTVRQDFGESIDAACGQLAAD